MIFIRLFSTVNVMLLLFIDDQGNIIGTFPGLATILLTSLEEYVCCLIIFDMLLHSLMNMDVW